jgi:hypothetical protein
VRLLAFAVFLLSWWAVWAIFLAIFYYQQGGFFSGDIAYPATPP